MLASSLGSEHGEGTIRIVHERDDIVAVCVEGDFDVATVSALREQVDGALASGNDLIFDLSEATFIDASVIRVLFDAAGALDGRDQTIVLQLGTARIVERALKIVSIERVLPRAHDREEAVRMIQRQAETV